MSSIVNVLSRDVNACITACTVYIRKAGYVDTESTFLPVILRIHRIRIETRVTKHNQDTRNEAGQKYIEGF